MKREGFHHIWVFSLTLLEDKLLPAIPKRMKSLVCILLLLQLNGFSQTTGPAVPGPMKPVNGFNAGGFSFVKNIGQYGETIKGHVAMGSVQYGFEGGDMLVLFTPKGLIHIHRKFTRLSEREERELKRKGVPEEELEKEVRVAEKTITMEWLGADPGATIIAEEQTTAYHTYGLLKEKASGYKKITYKNLYPGIDLVYHFNNPEKSGFEYSIVVQPGADPGLIKMKYGGDVKKINIDKDGNLFIRSGINDIVETTPVAFSNPGDVLKLSADKKEPIQSYPVSFQQQNNLLHFHVPVYDRTKRLIIDPFVSNTNAGLPGLNAGKAKDIDFDYAGNIYVAGGGSINNDCRLAKFDPSGTLLWTFNGNLPALPWSWGSLYGGWVVEKSTGNIFIGKGAVGTGTQVIRLTSAGVYDNYITVADPNFTENWKCLWSCNNGNPQILIAGGGINSNINVAICSPPTTTLASINLTGVPTAAQDIADIVIDPLTNDMYTIYASQVLSPIVNNRIYKNPPPYNAATQSWFTPTGFSSLIEIQNRPYLTTGGTNDNSINSLAVNSSYLYYWDGVNLKAFNKSDGSQAGNVLTFASNSRFMQGGIVADECNNIFIGNTNGTIKVYRFDGNTFDDAAAPDISIPGYPLASVYDLAYDPSTRLLYACGNGFVASFDISSYCPNTTFNLSVALDCPTLTAQATVSPTPPVGTVLTYALFVGATQVATNSTGLFTGLSLSTNYTVKAYLNQSCSGIQLLENFTTSNCQPVLSLTFINPSCNLNNGSIHAVAAGGILPYQFSKDGINFQASGIFTGLAAGTYTITLKDGANNIATANVTLVNSPALQLNAVSTGASCTQNNGSISASGSGGSPTLNYRLDAGNFQPSGIFTGLAPGNHTVSVRDTNNCIVTIPVPVDTINTVVADAGNNFSICEGAKKTMAATSNGASVLWTPSTGLSNPNILTPDATPLITTLYTLTATTGICKASSTVTVFVNPAPVVYAGRDTGICLGKDLQLNGSGGLVYVWTPATYLSDANIANPVVVQPPAGSITYHLSATDANGCKTLKDDDVTVTVSPEAKLFVGYDTAIAIRQPLQLFAVDVFNAGFINYTWSPTYGLNDPFSKTPVAILDRDIVYNVTASNAFGCTATDNIKIKVYQGPDIYVPNAFTPNGDGLNDVLRPVVIGMKEFHYFTVFNNYGQLVYTTAVLAQGWDGNFKGKQQPIGTYVWMAEAVDYKGNKVQRKGSAVLIR